MLCSTGLLEIYLLHLRNRSDLRYGLNKGHPTTPIDKVARPSHRKGIQSTRTKFVRSVIREVAGFSAYERRVLELLRNSKVFYFTVVQWPQWTADAQFIIL